MSRKPHRLLEALLDERELAALFRVSVRTVQDWRQSGKGPPFLKLTDKKHSGVRYHPADVRAYVAQRRASSEAGRLSDDRRKRHDPAEKRP